MFNSIDKHLRLTLKVAVAILLATLSFVGCRENDGDITTPLDIAVREAKIKYQENQQNLISKFKNKYSLTPQWNQGEIEKIDAKSTALFVPAAFDKNTGNKLTLVFTSDEKGIVKSQVIEDLPTGSYYKQTGAGSAYFNLTGNRSFYSIDAKFQIGGIFKNGYFTENTIPLEELNNISNRNLRVNFPEDGIDLLYVTIIGKRPNENPVMIEIPHSLFNPSGGVYNGYSYGSVSAGGGSEGSGNNGPVDDDYMKFKPGTDCNSFTFTQTASNWQEAGIRNNTVRIKWFGGGTAIDKEMNVLGQIVIGLPINRADGTHYSPNEAATLGAIIIDQARRVIFEKYKNYPFMPYDEEVTMDFMKSVDLIARAYGGTAGRIGSGNPGIIVRNAEYAFFGNGNC